MNTARTTAPTIQAFKRDADLLRKAWKPGALTSRIALAERLEAALPHLYRDRVSVDFDDPPPTRTRVLQLLATEAGHRSWDTFSAEQSDAALATKARYLVGLEELITPPSDAIPNFEWPSRAVVRAGNAVTCRFVVDRATGGVLALHIETMRGWAWVTVESLEVVAALLTNRAGGQSEADRVEQMITQGTTRTAYFTNTVPAWVANPKIGAKPPARRWVMGDGLYAPEIHPDDANDRKLEDSRYARHFPGWRKANASERHRFDRLIGWPNARLLDHAALWRTPDRELVLTAEPYQTAIYEESLEELLNAVAENGLTIERDGYSPYYPGATVLFIMRKAHV